MLRCRPISRRRSSGSTAPANRKSTRSRRTPSGRTEESASEDVDRIKDSASDAPVIRLVNLLIARAVEARASDIHIEPMDGELRVRYRVDGVLHEVESPPRNLAASVLSRIKVMAKLNIAERRVAQDGRIRLAVRGKDIDFRVSMMPTIHGECAVLRILDRGSLKLDFVDLGFDAETVAAIRGLLAQPHGIILATGPTGSGKTTTLYTSLLELNTRHRKILTIEDPVEYQLHGVNQVQVKPQIGLTFASALRSFLRQDPDVMMVGEIRDLETAQTAVQAALTGHLILSTLHTNDAASAVTRLLDMGIEDYLLTSTISGVIAQRLVRTLCMHCRKSYDADPALLDAPADRTAPGRRRDDALCRRQGCPSCNGTGYAGRSSIVEVLVMSDALRHLVLEHAEAGAIRKQADRGRHAQHARTRHGQGAGWRDQCRGSPARGSGGIDMPSFRYRAMSASGSIVTGVLEAPSGAGGDRGNPQPRPLPDRGAAWRRRAGRRVVARCFYARTFCRSRRFSPRGLVVATQELAALLRAGLELDRALGILVNLDETKPMRRYVRGACSNRCAAAPASPMRWRQNRCSRNSTSAWCAPANMAAICRRRWNSSANISAARWRCANP